MIKKHFWWVLCALIMFSVTIISWKPISDNEKSTKTSAQEVFEEYVATIYQTANLQDAGLDLAVFQKALTGYFNLKLANKLPQNSSVITVIDFSKSSCEKRMWIIDVLAKQLLLNTWVAHGQGSGDDMATQFSDNNDSHQSSLGFYLTDDVYNGKHGRSLRLDGLDEGFNASARARAIVIHAADYVGENAIGKLGRLGRSFGCPAVSPKVRDEVINTIKGKTVLFINGNDSSYTSKYLDESSLADFTPDSTDYTASASTSK
jgi:hypothetical protein